MSGRVFVVNCGSSSLKYRLVDPATGASGAEGIVERIGGPGARIVHAGDAQPVAAPDHEAALRAVLGRLGPALAGLAAVAHRVTAPAPGGCVAA